MTDNPVSNRLRARAIEAAELGFNPALDDEAADALDSQARRIADLERALRPFAEAARLAAVNGNPVWYFCDARDYEAALAALSGTTPPAGDALVEALEVCVEYLEHATEYRLGNPGYERAARDGRAALTQHKDEE